VRSNYPNGLTSNFIYDDLNRVTALNATRASYNYTLGPTGNRQSAVESSGRTLNWSYDGIYRLTQESISGDPHSVNGAVSYGLDPVGNRLSQASSLTGIAAGSFSYDADDRILATETYDNNGNTLVTGARTLTYDFENRLKTMTMGSSTVTIVYDADGNRVAKTANGVTTQYLVDDLNPTGYAQVVEELTNGAVTRQYSYGLQRINQNQLINNTWTPSLYGYDGFGSVRTLTDSTGTVTDTYDYDAWGNAVNTTGTTPNVYLYRGEQYDPDLRLYYLRARYLNSLTGRFLARDSALGGFGKPATLHKYAYSGADPVNRVDPSGDMEIEDALLAARALRLSEGAKSIGCAAGLAGVATTWLMGMRADGVAGTLTLAACGTLATETATKDPFGVVTKVWKWSGALEKFVGVAQCGYLFYKMLNAMAEKAGPALTDEEITNQVMEGAVLGFECGVFIGAEALL